MRKEMREEEKEQEMVKMVFESWCVIGSIMGCLMIIIYVCLTS
jgi:hypothetical protein